MSYSLYGKLGVLQRNAALTKYATVSVAVQNIGDEYFHPIGRVSGITTNFLSSLAKGKTIPILGASVGHDTMRQKPSLESALRTCTSLIDGLAILTSLMRRSNDRPCFMTDMAAMSKVSEFKLLKLYYLSHHSRRSLYYSIPGGISLNPDISSATEYGKTNQCPFSTIKENSSHKKGMCVIVYL